MRKLALCIAVALAAAAAVISLENLAVAAFFPHLTRVTTDFSPAYLDRELRSIAHARPQTIFLGDSVLWGYRLQPEQTAVAILVARGCTCRNLSFKASSPPNYYALVRLLLQRGIRPKVVVLEIDQRVLNPANQAYRTLHPAVAALSAPLLTAGDRETLGIAPQADTLAGQFDRIANRISLVYAMRADIRAVLYPQAEAVPLLHPTADMFEGEYDLSPLDEQNVGVKYLEKTADLLRAARIPALAFMTPTNHALLHDYIDGPEYRSNLLILKRLLENRGVTVLDLDRSFPGWDFYDYAHLRPAAQGRLADILATALAR